MFESHFLVSLNCFVLPVLGNWNKHTFKYWNVVDVVIEDWASIVYNLLHVKCVWLCNAFKGCLFNAIKPRQIKTFSNRPYRSNLIGSKSQFGDGLTCVRSVNRLACFRLAQKPHFTGIDQRGRINNRCRTMDMDRRGFWDFLTLQVRPKWCGTSGSSSSKWAVFISIVHEFNCIHVCLNEIIFML